MEVAPEFASVEAFVQFLMDDERSTFTPGEAQKVAEAVHRPIKEITEEIKGYGFTIQIHRVAEARGINSNNHDLYSAKNGWVMGQAIGNGSRQMVNHNPLFR